jgi:hypothetical protein
LNKAALPGDLNRADRQPRRRIPSFAAHARAGAAITRLD